MPATIELHHRATLTTGRIEMRKDESWQEAASRYVARHAGKRLASMATQHRLSDGVYQCAFVSGERGVGNVVGTYIVRTEAGA